MTEIEYFFYIHVPFALVYGLVGYFYYLYTDLASESYFTANNRDTFSAIIFGGILGGPVVVVIGIVIYMLTMLILKLDILFRKLVIKVRDKNLEKMIGKRITTTYSEIEYVILRAHSNNTWTVLSKNGHLVKFHRSETRFIDENDKK